MSQLTHFGDYLVSEALPEKPLTKEGGFDRLARGEPFTAFVGRFEELSVSTGANEVTHEALQTNSPRANGFLMPLLFFR